MRRGQKRTVPGVGFEELPVAVDFVEAGAAADGAATGIEIAVADMPVNLANRAGRRAAQGP